MLDIILIASLVVVLFCGAPQKKSCALSDVSRSAGKKPTVLGLKAVNS